MKHLFGIAIFLLLLVIPVAAQTPKSGRPFRVSVSIAADDVMQPTVTSKINAGLRSLGDVVLVDDDAILRISIVGVQNTTSGSRELGYTLSIVVTKAMPKREEQSLFKTASKSEGAVVFLTNLFADRVILIHHSILVDGSLDSICTRAVASIDVGPIEAERKYWQDIDDNTKRYLELQKKFPTKTVLEIQHMIDEEKAKKP